jgi:Isocitrate/isopropylmalate dehydrogenase
MMTKRTHRIASIPGDGIGKEVIPQGLRVLEAAASRFGFELQVDSFDFACADYYETHGRMMPADWNQRLQPYDAIFFGAVGWPEKVPDHISLWGSLVQFRRQFDQYVSLRPVRLMPGVTSPQDRFRHRPGEYGGRIQRGRRAAVRGYTPRVGLPGDSDDADWSGSYPTLRLRTGAEAKKTSHLGDQIQWDRYLDALLG